jgi:multidrug efflux pump subunit AcrA (membrane-fusion protein)
MNITTGINNDKQKKKGNRKRETGKSRINWFRIPKIIHLISVLSLTIFACTPKQQATEAEVSPKTDVRICSPISNNAERLLSFQAVTRYMQSNDIRSQITGIITQVNCSVASDIHTNQALFIIEPQEAAALKKMKFNKQILPGLSDTVYAHISGQISKLNVQLGDFVQIGDVLASCIRGNSMRIIAYIPVEQVSEIEKLKECMVILPDGSSIEGRISAKLPVADSNDQTQSYVIDTKKAVSLSENINLSVRFTSEQIQDAMFVPESAVLGNEEQTNFWVMKLINDSTGIKVSVEKGMKQDSLVQIIGAGLTINDRVISEGGYGLADSARIHVININSAALNTIIPPANRKATSSRH